MIQLYPYQKEASRRLQTILSAKGAALDASDTGVGKTFVALGTMKAMGAKPLIVCPKSIRTSWQNLAEEFGLDVLDVLNIEQLKTGKTPYLKKVSKSKWVWMLPRDSYIIYDEVQTASGYKSQNAKILALCKAYGLRVLMLSATAADSPLKLRAIGYLLGLHKWQDHYSWCKSHGCYLNSWGGLEFVQGPQRLQYMQKLHQQIFPDLGVRVRIQDLDVFPENAVFADSYDLDDRSTDEVNQIYAEMDAAIANPDENALPITLLLRARQRTELLKAPLIAEMVTELVDEGKSVAVFVNFRETMNAIVQALETIPCVTIAGGQAEEDRDASIAKFQRDEARVCVSMIQAGGVGVSLHDLNGNHPRVSLISPGYSARELKQALGRIHRAGAKSKCIQKIIFAARTVEEEACKSVKRKLDNISVLNDGDLSGGLLAS